MKLSIREEIMLLALKEREGTNHSGVMLETAMGGAVLTELLLAGRISIEESKQRYIVLHDPARTGDQLMDEALDRVATAKRRGSASSWVSRFSQIKHIKHRVAGSLCTKGVLREDEDKVLGLFRRKIYPEIDPVPEKHIIERIRAAVVDGSSKVDARTTVLIALAKETGLIKTVLTKQERKEHKGRLNDIANADLVGQATKEAVAAVQAAVMVAVMMPTIVST